MSADRSWERMDAAADLMDDVAMQLEGVSALVGQRARRIRASGEPGLELTVAEAQGFAGVLGLIAAQLRKAEADLRAEGLGQTG